MGKLSQSYAHNAGARQPDKPRIVTYKGKRKDREGNAPGEKGVKRKHLYPSGKVERFVNLQGTVVEIPLVPSGVPPTAEAVASARAKLHKLKSHDGEVEGFIEHGKCPLKNGIRDLTPSIEREFDEILAEGNVSKSACAEHPVTWQKTDKGIVYFDGCPHIEALITHRRAKHTERTNARRFKQKTVLQMEQEKVNLLKVQADKTAQILERVAESVAKPAKKATTE